MNENTEEVTQDIVQVNIRVILFVKCGRVKSPGCARRWHQASQMTVLGEGQGILHAFGQTGAAGFQEEGDSDSCCIS